MEEEPEGDLIDLATEDQKKIRQVLKQNPGRPKGRQPVGILQRVKKIGYQLNQKQGEPSEQTSDTDWQKDFSPFEQDCSETLGDSLERHLLTPFQKESR